MRVLHVDTAVEWRGGQSQMLHLVRRMPGEVHVAVRPDARILEPLRRSGAEVHLLPRSLRFRSSVALRRLVGRLRPDVVAAHTAHAHTACLAGALGLAPVVVHRRVDFAIRGVVSLRKYALATGYIAVSDAVAEILRGAGVPEERIAVVHDGVDPSGVQLYRGGGGVGALGALVGHKGHSILVDAMSELPDHTLRIAGKGWLRNELQRQAEGLGIADRVQLIGPVENQWAFLSELDVFVHPSVEEGLGQAIIEAMLAGVPVVVSNGGGIPEVVEDGITGRVVPVGDARATADAIRAVRDEPERTRAMVDEAQRVARERFSPEQMVDATMRAYERFGG